MSLLRKLHKKLLRDTLGRTQRVNLIRYIAPAIPQQCDTVLDIGCGDGLFAKDLLTAVPRLKIVGIETTPHDECAISQISYGGDILPFADKSFDYAMMINMLHHTANPEHMLAEACRVARYGVIIKDHYANTAFDRVVLMFMERVGMAFSGVALPRNFLEEKRWNALFKKLNLNVDKLLTRFVSYNPLVDILCGRNLHFIATLTHG